MEMGNLKNWLDLAQQFQTENFWNQIFEEKETNSSSKSASNPFSAIQEYFPKCDLYESQGNLIVEIEIPGVNKDDVYISINQQSLTVSGEFKSLHPNRKYYLKERANRKFKKELTLPFPVDLNKSFNEFSNGVLVINMPLTKEEPKDIPVSFEE